VIVVFCFVWCVSLVDRLFDVLIELPVFIYTNANPSIFTERYDQCGKQHHSREFLMMCILMLETC